MPKHTDGQKEFIFPENVQSDYGVWLGLSLKELGFYVAPVAVIVMIFIALPPYSLMYMLVKVFVGLLIITVDLAILSTRPVAYRNNIKLLQHMKMKRKFGDRQKRYYKAKRKIH